MHTTKLLKLRLNNFKGIASGEFNFNGQNAEIVADVMQGKSTIKDAYLWCLGMEIDNFYPVDKNNRIIEGLETKVELTIDVDGIEYKLSRSAKVKYKNKVFDGYKKDMFEFDCVPCNTTEYKNKLCALLGIADFDTLKYLSVLNYFNEQVNWKERRELIYNLFVNKSAIEELKNEPKYDLIANELKKGKSTSDINTMLNSENNRIVENKRRNEILLADTQQELATFAKIDYAKIEVELEEVDKKINDEQERIAGLDRASVKNQIINEINKLTIERENLYHEGFAEECMLHHKEEKLFMESMSLKGRGENLEKTLAPLTEEYKKLKVEQFDERNTICPTCRQQLKKSDIDELRESWEINKENRLSRLKSDILKIKQEYEAVKEEYTAKLAELDAAKKAINDFEMNPKIEELNKKIEQLQEELKNVVENKVDYSYLTELKDQRNFLIVELGKRDSYEKLKEKYTRLAADQRTLFNAEIVLAKKRNQLEQYTIDVINIVSNSINDCFDGVKFKLFEELTATASKSIKETLVCLNNGVDYNAQSTGQKANSNCVIVATLQERLGVNLPIWLDDASILHLKNEPNNQLIYLLNEKGKKLECVRIDELY